MAGKQFPYLAHARPASSRCLLAVGALLLLSASYFLLSPSSPRPSPHANRSPASPTASFLASLDHFLSSPRPTASSAAPGDLDAAIRREEESRLYGDPGGAWPAAAAPLRVYVYEMPSKFTYDLLRLFRDSYRETTNLTSNGSPVHRLIEQGGKIRSKLVTELNTKDIVIEEGTAGAEGKEAAQKGMRKSLFCLSPAGDTPSSARLFDAIVSGCIPVIISDELELPFEGILDYRKIALFVSSSDAVQPGWLVKYLRGIDAKRLREMQSNLVKYSRHFLYSSPAQPLGPEDLTWRMIAGKLVNIKLHIHRSQRVVRESRSLCTCECRVGNTTRML